MAYRLVEAEYSDLSDLIREAKGVNAFLPIKEDEEPFLDSMGQFEGLPDHHFFLFREEGSAAVGFAVVLPHREAGVLTIGPVYVSERHRGRGLGGQMLEELITWSRLRGVRGLFTETWGRNDRSRRLLEAAGFRFLGEKPLTRVDGDSTVQYFLELSPDGGVPPGGGLA
jgi:GNAT superfamily N-acetyltransferase